jgi:hypothetical protein
VREKQADPPPFGTRSPLAIPLGAPGSFQRSLNIEPVGDLKTIATQYLRLAFDHTGHMYCVYRWSERRKDSPHHGTAIMLARVSEERLASGKAMLADVEKRVACEMAKAP